MSELRYKIAEQAAEFEAIHRLNYQTFVLEIPQHRPNERQMLVDRFHNENIYAVCMDGSELVGMVAGRCARPFSLDSKVDHLDSHLPNHRKAVEIRLLAVKPEYRHRPVFARLVSQLARHFRSMDCDLAVISGTVRQLELYEHMGFRKFGPLVGSADALFQPMYLTLPAWQKTKSLSGQAEPRPVAAFLPGPVEVSSAVRRAFQSRAQSHRSSGFTEQMGRVRSSLCRLTGAQHVALLVGTGTLANDAIAAQISQRGEAGLVLANGEFGERLAAHASAWKLPHDVIRVPWGDTFCWDDLHYFVDSVQPAWIWAVLSETSTGMNNHASRLQELCDGVGASLCLDAISAVGLMPVNLRNVWLASTVSGKALASYAGLAAVFHDGRLAPAGSVPRYLDLTAYEQADSVPYTHSSNLLAALDEALASTSWTEKFERVSAADSSLRARLQASGLTPLVPAEAATPGIITLEMPAECDAREIAVKLQRDGLALAHESAYLRRRNWLQICLMSDFDISAVERIPELLAFHLRTRSTTRLRRAV